MRNLFNEDVNNSTAVKNVYPTANGPTTGVRASAATPYAAALTSQTSQAGTDSDGAIVTKGAFLGQPFTWWGLLFAMLLGLMFVARKLGSDDEFRNIRLSAYNVIVISLAAIVGIAFFKVVFSRFRVPGLSDVVAAV